MVDGYVHGYATAEQNRLIAQAEHWRDELILDGTSLSAGTRLLEVGCGVGAVMGILGSAFPGIELTGVDLEERQLETARSHLASLGLAADLRRADALSLPFADETFDHVWMMWFLEHVRDPVGALREARRVLVPRGVLTSIEVDYNTVWASPSTPAFEAMFRAVAQAMDASGRSDAGSRVAGWLEEAGFESIDPGERRLAYSGDALVRQVSYVASVVGSTRSGRDEGLADLRKLPSVPDSSIGWIIHKATARR